ncbi:MAG: ABC transporter permease [Phycisphaerae bacterium]|nr:MAG: hypothetical protein EDS66_00800 [Planctomycetota bacterium]KAB2945439.1 MAG: ABC transporter permease [Phycisphaerae bacterium]MBE7458156.1 ABC transporter permease [Planctomycetia bacterium]MCL4718070.1 ABC transporter permease [Phycisphaerae bacterium]MCQ3920204.1 hypothetical protein [Planctomycetota bacterium]
MPATPSFTTCARRAPRTLAHVRITTTGSGLGQRGAKTTGRIKRIIFGGAIGLIACYKGFPCRSGAEGVGRACTEAFIVSFIAILASGFFFATLMQGLYRTIRGFRSLIGCRRFAGHGVNRGLGVPSYLLPRCLWSFSNTSLRAQLQNRAAPVRKRGFRVLQAGYETAS